MPLIFQPERGNRSGNVAKEAPANHSVPDRAPVNGAGSLTTSGGFTGPHRPTLNENATLPGIDSFAREDVNQIVHDADGDDKMVTQ